MEIHNKKLLIIFDMDGLMFDTESLAIKLWVKVGKRFGYTIKPSHVFETIGIGIDGTKRVLERYFGEDFPFWKIRTLREEYAFNHIKENGIPVKKELYKLLDFLEDNGIKKAVATSSERIKAEKYLRSGNVVRDLIALFAEMKLQKENLILRSSRKLPRKWVLTLKAASSLRIRKMGY